MKFWVKKLFVFHLRAMAMVQQGTQGLLQATVSQAHPKNDRVKTEYSFFWSVFWGSVLLWFRSPVVYEQSWTATAFPVPLWVLALEPSLGDSTQLILLQCQLTNSSCNSWAGLLLNAGFLMELWVTPSTILNFLVQLNKELKPQAELLATTPSNLRLLF